MQGVIFHDGYDATESDLTQLQARLQTEVKRRIVDTAAIPSYGVVSGLRVNYPTQSAPWQLDVEAGFGYDENGEYCKVAAPTIQAFSAGDVGKYLLLSYGYTDSDSRAHPITGAPNSFRRDDSYSLTLSLTIGTEIPLCKISAIDGGGIATLSVLSQTDRYYWSALVADGMIGNSQIDPNSDVAKHITYLGHGVWSVYNAHALSPEDIGVDTSGVPVHQKYYHATGIRPDSVSSVLSMTVNAAPAVDELNVQQLAATDRVTVQGWEVTSINPVTLLFSGAGVYPELYEVYVDKDGALARAKRLGLGAAQTILGVWIVDINSDHPVGTGYTLSWDGTTKRLYWNGATTRYHQANAGYDGFVQLFGPNGIDWILVYVDDAVICTELGTVSDSVTVSAPLNRDNYLVIGNVNWSGSGLPYQNLLGYGSWGGALPGLPYDKRQVGNLAFVNIRDDFKQEQFYDRTSETVQDGVVSGLQLYLAASTAVSYHSGAAYVGGKRVEVDEGSVTFHQPGSDGNWDYWLDETGTVVFYSAATMRASAAALPKFQKFLWLGWAKRDVGAFSSPVTTISYQSRLDNSGYKYIVGPAGSSRGDFNGDYALNRLLEKMVDGSESGKVLVLNGAHKLLVPVELISGMVVLEGESLSATISPDDSVALDTWMLTFSDTTGILQEFKRISFNAGAINPCIFDFNGASVGLIQFEDCDFFSLLKFRGGANQIKFNRCTYTTLIGDQVLFAGPCDDIQFDQCKFYASFLGTAVRVLTASAEVVGHLRFSRCGWNVGLLFGGGNGFARSGHGVIDGLQFMDCTFLGQSTLGSLLWLDNTLASTDKAYDVVLDNVSFALGNNPFFKPQLSINGNVENVEWRGGIIDCQGNTTLALTGGNAVELGGEKGCVAHVLVKNYEKSAVTGCKSLVYVSEITLDDVRFEPAAASTAAFIWSSILYANGPRSMNLVVVEGMISATNLSLYVIDGQYPENVSGCRAHGGDTGGCAVRMMNVNKGRFDFCKFESLDGKGLYVKPDSAGLYIQITNSRVVGLASEVGGSLFADICYGSPADHCEKLTVCNNLFGTDDHLVPGTGVAVVINTDTICEVIFLGNQCKNNTDQVQFNTAAIPTYVRGIETNWAGGYVTGNLMILNMGFLVIV